VSIGAPQEYTLAQMLSEMDSALADEIKKQSTKRTADHVAVDGKLIAEESGRYVYAFSLQDPWEPEDDTPVRVKISGSPAIRGAIVTSTGTTITIATESKLTAEGLRRVELVDDATELLERLREALKNNDEGPAQLGSKVLGLTGFSEGKRSPSVSFGKFRPDEAQKRAIEMALGSQVLYLIGPPGTGKTSTLAAMAFAHLREGRTVLIAAHTNIAVDNAIMKLAEMCQDAGADPDVKQFLKDGLIVRYGTPQDRRLIENDKYAEVYLPGIVRRRGSDLHQQVEKLRVSLQQVMEQLARLKGVQQQSSGQREAERENLSRQCEALKREIALLQAREARRNSSLMTQLNEVAEQWRQAEQRMTLVQQEFGEMTAQQVQLQMAQQQHLVQVEQISSQLAAAQQMNALKRLLKGINLERTGQQLLEVKQQVWREEQWLNDLQARIEAAHRCYETAIEETRRLSNNYSVLKAELNTPSNDARQIAPLQASLAPLTEQIKTLEASLERERAENERQCRSLDSRRAQLEEEIAAIDRQLANLEKSIVANARVVATTLSKIYMSQSLSERRFDSVILDEVSMAPLPTVYIAASRAEQSVVTIGDPKQLAPIINARESALARKWLGTDVFALREITLEKAQASGAGNSAVLTSQSRMHPAISVIARKHVYRGIIDDRNSEPPEKRQQYENVSPMPEKRLLLCDTSDAMPFVTRPEGGSRINIYHALCTISLARQIHATLPPDPEQKGMPRIGLVTPYRKQAELLQQLIQDNDLKDRVRAGTVHKFQGLEFDAVIFDTVESPPFSPVQDFTAGRIDTEAMRLINVAVTRPRHKLIIVANRDYIHRTFQEDDILRLAVGEAEKVSIPSRQVLSIPAPLTNDAQTLWVGQAVAPLPQRGLPDASQYDPELLDDRSFFDRFLGDVRQARKQIIIYSPFLDIQRTRQIAPELGRKRGEGVKVVVVASLSRETNPTTGEVALLLKEMDVELRTSSGMHQKLVFIDEEIVYTGSLNVLSHGATTEFMERVKSPRFVKKVWQFMNVDTVAQAPVKWGPEITIFRWEMPEDVCEKCGQHMIPKIGKYGPFYGCKGYSRGCRNTREVSEKHLSGLPQLENVRCDGCKTGALMRIKTHRKDAWLECAASTPCGYRRNIKIQ
jgi:hypothetical protein